MGKAMKICRVCGKEYEYCHTVRRVPGLFRWQDVACSPECGEKYLADIIASRSEEVKPAKKSKKKSVAAEVPVEKAVKVDKESVDSEVAETEK